MAVPPMPVEQPPATPLHAALPAASEIRMISASMPSSFRNPRFCARGKVINWPANPVIEILILSAALTEEWTRKNVNKAQAILFICNVCRARSSLASVQPVDKAIVIQLLHEAGVREIFGLCRARFGIFLAQLQKNFFNPI